jgi:hypothetical protein
MCSIERWKVRVAANDPMIWSHIKTVALVENDREYLNDEDLGLLLDDAYIPRDKLDNPALLKWFNEIDAWWFDNIRFNAEHLEPYKRALALTAGMMVGDYVLSFNEQTRSLREPFSLSKVFHLILDCLPYVPHNEQRNKSTNHDVRAFIAESHHTDLLFLRLPEPIRKRQLEDHLPPEEECFAAGMISGRISNASKGTIRFAGTGKTAVSWLC